ncbi:MAG: medium chain dehydrogenase/reductase family protein [Candidatus Lernaella stagnicola]|nr:medium chain dehydrogenase/reductase family protein [Candidatus Lernaella stagnicola]
MRQIWIPRVGGPEVLEVRETIDPTPKPGEVRIRVEASGINFADIMARMGMYQDAPPVPSVVGYEVAGKIDRVGDAVEGFAVGDRVASFTRFGGYSDVVVASVDRIFPLPPEIDTKTAAGIPVNFLTAWLMLVRFAGVKENDTVLVQNAGGGVGLAALQISRAFGANVIGTASPGKHERLREMGAAHCIDYRSLDFETAVKDYTNGRGVDVVIDPVGGKSFKKSFRCLAPLGRLAMFGVSSFAPGKTRNLLAVLKGFIELPRFSPVALMNDNRAVGGFNMGHLWDETDILTQAMEKIMALVAKGEMAPVIDKTFPFDQAGAAHAYIQDRKNFGKVLLTP